MCTTPNYGDEMLQQPKRAARLASQRIFNLDLPVTAGAKPGLFRKLYNRSVPSLERLFALDRLNAIYNNAADTQGPTEFMKRLLEQLRLHFTLTEEDIARIPKTGPLVVVANHPFGGLDGIAMALVLSQVRPDLKIMANYILNRIPNLRNMFIFVDPFRGEDATASNMRPMRESLRCLKNGGCLACFPAGEVAHLNLKQRQVTDPAWNPTIARIIKRSGAAVLPIFFNGHNGKLFQIMGLLHSKLRTAMLPRAFFNRHGGEIDMRIGNVITPRKIASLETEEEVLAYIRSRTYLLKNRASTQKAAVLAAATAGKRRLLRFRRGKTAIPVEQMQAIIAPVDPLLLAAEVAQLGNGDHLLVEHDDLCVYQAKSDKIPNVLRELGRLRETTFRATGEGTGRSTDLDRFDYDYIHMFIWNRKVNEVVGAYRLGPSDEILRNKGKSGLYTSTLFDYEENLLEQIGTSLEMGRSFVRESYQRSFAPLLLLWKGIGQFCVRHPKYKVLFGPVSISASYQSASRQLIVEFLREHHLLADLAQLVRPRHPYREHTVTGFDKDSVKKMVLESDDLSELVSDLEPDQKGIPILLKQYLKLGAKLLAVNLDPDFSDVIDGLIVVDLMQSEPKILDKYMGKDGRASFFAYHNAKTAEKDKLVGV